MPAFAKNSGNWWTQDDDFGFAIPPGPLSGASANLDRHGGHGNGNFVTVANGNETVLRRRAIRRWRSQTSVRR